MVKLRLRFCLYGNRPGLPGDVPWEVLRLAVLFLGMGLTAGCPTGAVAQSSSAAPFVEAGFSPEGTAEVLVLKTIRSARSQVRLLAYSFTSVSVVRELIDAKRRGVDVAIVVDFKNNVQEDRYGKARAALSALANAGINVSTVSGFAIHHDKVIVVDGLHVETGSYNFSEAAARRNSENVLVLWNQPAVAKIYLQHWASRFALATPFRTQY